MDCASRNKDENQFLVIAGIPNFMGCPLEIYYEDIILHIRLRLFKKLDRHAVYAISLL